MCRGYFFKSFYLCVCVYLKSFTKNPLHPCKSCGPFIDAGFVESPHQRARSNKKLENDDRQKAQLNVVVLCLWYKNADPATGKYLKKKDKDGNEYFDPIEWQIGFLKLSRSGYRRVSMLIQEEQKPHEFDMVISHKDSGIGFDYNVISQKVRFRQIPELLEEVMEAAQPFKDGKKLTEKLGKKITELEFAAMLSGKPATSAKDATVDDVSDL